MLRSKHPALRRPAASRSGRNACASSGQGASIAIEDALALAQALRDEPGVDRALVTDEPARRARVEAVVAAGRMNGDPKTRFGRVIRDAILRVVRKGPRRRDPWEHLQREASSGARPRSRAEPRAPAGRYPRRVLRLAWLSTVAFWLTLVGRVRRGRPRPSWGFVFECVVTMLRLDWVGLSTWDPARARADLDRRPYPRDALRRVRTETVTIAGRRATRLVPPTAEPGTVLYLHGGSYVVGSAVTHGDVAARIALASGRAVLLPEYRLAPEHPYPAALDDADAVLGELDAARVVVAGDSAGGNLALALQLRRKETGRAQARAAVLISPWADLTHSAPSHRRNLPTDYGTVEMLDRQARMFAGALALDDPRVSLVRAELAGVAPFLVTAGDAELLHDACVELYARARAAGADATLEILRDMPHNGPVLAGFHSEGARGIEVIGRYVRAALDR